MTDIEARALALVNEVRAERGQDVWRDVGDRKGYGIVLETLCRAIEAHGAFRQEVSEVISDLLSMAGDQLPYGSKNTLSRFIIQPTITKEEAVAMFWTCPADWTVMQFREHLEKRGYKHEDTRS